MFWMQSNGESDENILYPLTTKWQRLRLDLLSVFFLHDVIRGFKVFVSLPITLCIDLYWQLHRL